MAARWVPAQQMLFPRPVFPYNTTSSLPQYGPLYFYGYHSFFLLTFYSPILPLFSFSVNSYATSPASEGGTTKDRFLAYLREDLLPCLKEGDIVVMDNLRAHHTKGEEELLRSVGAVPLYLPPYSPDFNPIEKMWFKMKAILRKMRVRSHILLDNTVQQVLLSVSSEDCDGWFQCDGY